MRRRRQPIPLPRLALLVGVVGAAVLAVTGSPTTGLSPSLDARDAEARPAAQAAQATTPDPTPTPTTAPTPRPGPTLKPSPTPEPRSAKEERTQKKAEGLAAALAEDVAGASRADVRRGIPARFDLGTGRAIVRLQVLQGERWSNVARLSVPKGKSRLKLKPGVKGRQRLAAATVKADRVQARYAVSLDGGDVQASARRTFKLTR